jgi:hypothetical protein
VKKKFGMEDAAQGAKNGKKPRRLVLHRETLQLLDGSKLLDVAAGDDEVVAIISGSQNERCMC